MAMVNVVDKRVAKATLGLLVATRGLSPMWAAQGVEVAAAKLGLQLGDLSSLRALDAYANGVADKGEKVSNRKWAEYSQAVQKAAFQLANAAEHALDELYC